MSDYSDSSDDSTIDDDSSSKIYVPTIQKGIRKKYRTSTHIKDDDFDLISVDKCSEKKSSERKGSERLLQDERYTSYHGSSFNDDESIYGHSDETIQDTESEPDDIKEKRKIEAKKDRKKQKIMKILDTSLNKDRKLRPHQREAIMWMINRTNDKDIPGGILQMRQGLGKTLCGLFLAWMHRKKGKTLIIADISIIGEWMKELETFFNGKDGPKLRVLVLHAGFIGSGVHNISIETLDDYDVVITNYHACITSAKKGKHYERVLIRGKVGKNKGNTVGYKHVTSCGENDEAIGVDVIHNYPWYHIIADEAHKMCNMNTSTFRSILSIYAKYRWAYTGTPQKNRDTDMWSILFFCGYNGVNNPTHWSHNLWKTNEELRKCLFYKELKEKDAIELKEHQVDLTMTEKHIIEHEITFNDNEIKVYRYFFDELWSAYQKLITGPDGTVYMTILGLFSRLRQMCIASHLICNESLREVKEQIERGKDISIQPTCLADSPDDDISALEEWVHNEILSGRGSSKMKCVINTIFDLFYGTDEKIIVFTAFSSALYLLWDALVGEKLDKEEKKKLETSHMLLDDENIILVDGTSKGYTRRRQLDQFIEDPKIRILLTNYNVSSSGLNLQVASQILLLDPWWSHVTEDQAISRAWRPGQTRDVYVHRFVVKGSIERQMLNICASKRNMASSYIDVNTKRVRIPPLDKETLGRILNGARPALYAE